LISGGVYFANATSVGGLAGMRDPSTREPASSA
jgi:hypothetical protein